MERRITKKHRREWNETKNPDIEKLSFSLYAQQGPRFGTWMFNSWSIMLQKNAVFEKKTTCSTCFFFQMVKKVTTRVTTLHYHRLGIETNNQLALLLDESCVRPKPTGWNGKCDKGWQILLIKLPILVWLGASTRRRRKNLSLQEQNKCTPLSAEL